MTRVTYGFATVRDGAAIGALLQECALPNQDIHAHLRDFILAKNGEQLAAAVGLEVCGKTGLLRSLVVRPTDRGHGIGNMLVERIVAHAHARGIAQLYLLTTSAERFFSKLGFSKIDRSSAAAEVLSTEEFRSLCPGSAVCMVRDISHELGAKAVDAWSPPIPRYR
jgi:amino-acid N-acetyltransferase